MSNLSAILPLACFALLLVTFHGRGARPADAGWRSDWMAACVVWGLAALCSTELLSLARSLDRAHVLVAWSALAVSLIAVRWLHIRRAPARLAGVRRVPWLEQWHRAHSDKWLLAGVALVVACTGLIAVLASPNNYDSMTYHMSRVAHWIQNRSVEHYPTAIDRQLYMGPWAEFAILQFQVLTGDDRWANLVQWMSMISCLVGISLVTALLGGGKRAQILSVVFVVTIPMGILQASSTQNDYVLAFWCVCAAYFGLRLFRATGRADQLRSAVPLGASLGLALLTKGTAYLFALPLLTACVVWSVRRDALFRVGTLGIVGLISVMPNVGHWTRNVYESGRILGPRELTDYVANEVVTPAVVASNVVRNIGLHVPVPMPIVRRIHAFVRLDVNDPRTSFGDGRPSLRFRFSHRQLHEDFSGNFLHALMLAAAIVAAVLARRHSVGHETRAIAVAGLVSFLAFCAYLKWQPWGSRLHLPLFVLGAPVVALLGDRLFRPNHVRLVAAMLLVSASPWVFFNDSRPLIASIRPVNVAGAVQLAIGGNLLHMTREEHYFVNRPDLLVPYMDAANRIKSVGCRNVGLVMAGNDYEYPLWVLLGSHGRPGTRLAHGTSSSEPAPNDLIPCAQIVVDGSANPPSAMRHVYRDEWRSPPLTLFTRPRDIVQSR